MLMDRNAIIEALDKVEADEPKAVKRSGYADQLAYLAHAFSADVLDAGNECNVASRQALISQKKYILCLNQLSGHIDEVENLREIILKLQQANESLTQTANNQQRLIVELNARVLDLAETTISLRRLNRNQATRINRKGKKCRDKK